MSPMLGAGGGVLVVVDLGTPGATTVLTFTVPAIITSPATTTAPVVVLIEEVVLNTVNTVPV